MLKKVGVLVVVLLVALLAAIVLAAGVPLEPLVYTTPDGFEAVSASVPYVDGIPFVESSGAWVYTTTLTGTTTISTATSSYVVEVARLRPGDAYTDTNEVWVVANSAEWGSLGVTRYIGEGIYTLVGYGYEAVLPEDTLWWDSDTGSWTEGSIWDYKTVVKVPIPEPPPTPTVCAAILPAKPFLYPNGTVCADEQPYVEGTPAVYSVGEGYNWIVGGELSGTLVITTEAASTVVDISHIAPERSYISTALIVTAPEWAGISIAHYAEKDSSNVEIFAIGGSGYQIALTDWWEYEILWWDGAWVTDPEWSDTTILGVEYPWYVYLPLVVR